MEHRNLLWIQIPCRDLSRAALFYRKVFDCKFHFEDLNHIPHAIFQENGLGQKPMNGALIEVPDEYPLGTGPVLFWDATARFEELEERIKINGGKLLREKTLIKTEVGDGFSMIPYTYVDNNQGYYAHFLDSEGNRMGLYGTY